MFKRLVTLCFGFAILASPELARADVKVSVVHGIPGAVVDVYANGGLLLEDFVFGTVTPSLSVPAGTYDIKVFLANQDPTSSVPVVSLLGAQLADGQNATVVAHLSASGAPTLTPFFNDLSSIGNGNGLPPAAFASTRLAVRHTALAPTVSVMANGKALVTLSNGSEAGANVRTHGYAVWLALPGTRKPVYGPVNLNLQPGKLLVVYAVGSIRPEDGTFTLLTQSFDLRTDE